MRRWLPIAALLLVFVGVAASASAQSNSPNQVLHTAVTASLGGSGMGSVQGCDNESPAACIDCSVASLACLHASRMA